MMNDVQETFLTEKNISVHEVLTALSNLRVKPVKEEYKLQDQIAQCLKNFEIDFKKEYRLGQKNRIDFLAGTIGIEVKKGKPNRDLVIQQLIRYSSFGEISSLILVIERSLDIPSELNGKPCITLSLNKLWGVAI